MRSHLTRSRGFSLLEMIVVVAVITIILAAIFSQVIQAQQRNSAEQVKLDVFQEAREFLDQLTRDLHQAGYPNERNYGPGQLADPLENNAQIAVGLVKIDAGELIFEGDVTGDGTVSTIQYKLDSNGPNCPCLKRSSQPKMNGLAPGPSPIGGQPDPIFEVEVQHVTNDLTTQPIFTAYRAGDANTPVTLPSGGLYWNSADAANQSLLGSINTIKVNLVVQSKITDPVTRLTPTASLASTVKLNNCSLASSGSFFNCSY